MARIKPQALLNQSKKKKGPSRISISTIVVCNLVVAVVVLSLVTTYRHWSQRSRNTLETQSHSFEDTNAVTQQKNHDLPVPGYADISTSKGLITVELFKDASPEAVDQFLDLCQKDHFKGMPFHRVIKNYLVQAGHSSSSIPVEEWTAKGKLRGRLDTSPKHEAFMLGTPKNKGNNKDFELLITTAPIPDLNDQLIVFGRVLKGEDVVQEIEEVDTDEHFQPKSQIGIISIVLKREL
ncbi:Peptidyl-prolyl cis-trans isomerase CYP21-4 [Hirschfeldia incana]|nr:Peptidyl-prolyl cis-trans isomerase CYP21-4 [Hirschfeldia incana]KAJ0234142.1 Peptidyl-prolyl cis-trans isomerase CYP21-4 [Hirschfeldia incana]KAJ0234143.1 Peptidyl-prolyl cis-trans isomerase CYP21-4 [Hirschfeldia incana]KAJ0234144.1 Peptidyl-prolyl cis-trans isomerase CYP21-4 [Hirschfeldia incana]KAJ0234145.1 Peptidyl-prolyl cis-trans isomerase CYP21-4 [Hirschfeldia incana]